MIRRAVAAMLIPLAIAFASGSALADATAPIVGLPPTQIVTSKQLLALANTVAHGLVHDADRVVTPAYTVQDQHVVPGAVSLTTNTPQAFPTYIAVPIQIAVDGKLVRTVVVGYRVQQYVKTAVAAHDLQPGTILAAGDLTMAREPFNGRPPVEPSGLVGRKLLSATSHGSMIYTEQTVVNEIVRVGQGAILEIRDGPVMLTADVVARTSGGMGDTVTVYDAKTDKILSGVVTGPNLVELNLPQGDAQ